MQAEFSCTKLVHPGEIAWKLRVVEGEEEAIQVSNEGAGVRRFLLRR